MIRQAINYRKLGFTQRKPTEPGVYFISTDHARRDPIPPREHEGWDVAEIIFLAGSYDNVYHQREEFARWHVKTLSGLEYTWGKGMWIKGPIRPVVEAVS